MTIAERLINRRRNRSPEEFNRRVNALLLQYLFAFLRGVFGTLAAVTVIWSLVWLIMPLFV